LQRGDMPQSIQRFDAGLRHLRGGMAKTSLGSIITGGAHMLGYTLYSYIPLLRPLLSLSYRSRLQTMKELVNLYYQVSFTYFWVELARSFESTMKQRYIAGLLGKSRELALAYNETGIGWAVIAFAGAARRNIRRGKKLALRLNDHLALGNNLYFAGLIQQWTGHNPEAAQSFREAIEIHERIGALFELELEYTSLAQSLRHLGKLDQSCEFIMKLKEIAESVKDYRGIADAYYELAEYFYYNGNFEEARQNVALCFQYCNEASNPLLYSIGKRVLGKILLREGRLPQAIHELEESRRIASGRWLLGEYMLDTYISLGEAYLQQLQQDAAMPAERRKALCRDIEKMLRFCRLHAITSRNFVGPRYRLKAMYRQHIGQPKQAAACFEKAIATLSRQGQKYELARTFIHYAHFLQTTDKARADDLLAQAAALFRECNARGELADHAPVAEPAIGPARPVSPSPYPDHLQDMEKTVNLRERSPDVRGH
jgi:tetratricopeptide (TPR) repeat protein